MMSQWCNQSFKFIFNILYTFVKITTYGTQNVFYENILFFLFYILLSPGPLYMALSGEILANPFAVFV